MTDVPLASETVYGYEAPERAVGEAPTYLDYERPEPRSARDTAPPSRPPGSLGVPEFQVSSPIERRR
jgi:hypothetical protein